MEVTVPEPGAEPTPAVPETAPAGQPAPAAPQAEQPAAPTETPAADPDKELSDTLKGQQQAAEQTKEILASHNVNFDELTSEYETKGELSAETYKKLADAGFPQTVVDSYISGINATTEQFTNAVVTHAGGKEQYQQVQSFVASQGQEACDAYNELMATGDLKTIKLFVSGLKAQMQLKSGTSNPTYLGGTAPAQSGYATDKEMVAAMGDTRYGRDATYTNAVRQKVALSTHLFN